MLSALLLLLSQSVVMDVSVVDKKGVPVPGLTAADFVVLEDAKPVRVTAVESITVSSADAEGRVAVLFMDDSTPSPTGEGRQAREIAHHFINALGPSDVAGVLFAAGASGVQSLTTDRVSLRAAVNRFESRVGNWTTNNAENRGRLERGGFDRYDSASISLYRTTLQSLVRLIGRLSVIENRRKAIVMISSGIPFTPPDPRKLAVDDPTGTADAVLEDMRTVIRLAQMARVTIYTVDPGGLRLAASAFDEVTSLTAEAPAPRVTALGKANQAFLRSLSINTGGFATVNTNETRAAATEIMKDLGGYYMIRFDSDQAIDRFRPVTVKVNRPGVTVRARPGYWPYR